MYCPTVQLFSPLLHTHTLLVQTHKHDVSAPWFLHIFLPIGGGGEVLPPPPPPAFSIDVNYIFLYTQNCWLLLKQSSFQKNLISKFYFYFSLLFLLMLTVEPFKKKNLEVKTFHFFPCPLKETEGAISSDHPFVLLTTLPL